jgi:polyferredoxin
MLSSGAGQGLIIIFSLFRRVIQGRHAPIVIQQEIIRMRTQNAAHAIWPITMQPLIRAIQQWDSRPHATHAIHLFPAGSLLYSPIMTTSLFQSIQGSTAEHGPHVPIVTRIHRIIPSSHVSPATSIIKPTWTINTAKRADIHTTVQPASIVIQEV